MSSSTPSSNTDLSNILSSPKTKIASLLQSYVDKHPDAIPKNQIKTIDSALLNKLHQAAQTAMKAKNPEHLLACIKTITLLADKKDMRTKMVENEQMRDFICIMLYQHLHAALAKKGSPSGKAAETLAKYDQCCIEWLAVISAFSKNAAVVETIAEKNAFSMIDLLLRGKLSLELRRDLAECLVHLVGHPSKKLSNFFFSNSQWKNYMQRIMKQVGALGDITSQLYFMQFFSALAREKKCTYADLCRWFPSKELATLYEEQFFKTKPSSIRQAVFDYMIQFNARLEHPTVHSFELESLRYGKYLPESHRPHVHFGSTSLQFEMSFPGEKEPSLTELQYSNVESVSIHTTSGEYAPSINVKLAVNEEPELDPHFSPSDNEVMFQMKERESLRVFRGVVVDWMRKESEKLIVEEMPMLEDEEEDADTQLTNAETAAEPTVEPPAKKMKKFSTTPKVAVPRREAYSEIKNTVQGPPTIAPNDSTPVRSKKAKASCKKTRSSPEKKPTNTRKKSPPSKENIVPPPINIPRTTGYDSDNDTELKDWDKIAARAGAPAVGTRLRSSTHYDEVVDDDVDSNFGELSLEPVVPLGERRRNVSAPVRSTTNIKKRKRADAASHNDLHTLFNQVHDAIEQKRAKRRKLIDSLGQQAQQHVDQKIEDAILRAENQKQELEADYKDKMGDFRNQISSITSEMRAAYSKFQTLLKSKTKMLNGISKQIDQTKARFEEKLQQQGEQASSEMKRLEEEMQQSLEQYQDQVEAMKAVGENALKEVLTTFITSFE